MNRSPPSRGVGSSEKNWNRVRRETFVSEVFSLSWEDCVGSGYPIRLDCPTGENFQIFEKVHIFSMFFITRTIQSGEAKGCALEI